MTQNKILAKLKRDARNPPGKCGGTRLQPCKDFLAACEEKRSHGKPHCYHCCWICAGCNHPPENEWCMNCIAMPPLQEAVLPDGTISRGYYIKNEIIPHAL